jgi:hypothetical protein
MLEEVEGNISQTGRHGRAGWVPRRGDEIVNAGQGDRRPVPNSIIPARRDDWRSWRRGPGIDGDRRRAKTGKDLPGVGPGDGDYSEALGAGKPSEGGGGCEATPAGLRREGQIQHQVLATLRHGTVVAAQDAAIREKPRNTEQGGGEELVCLLPYDRNGTGNTVVVSKKETGNRREDLWTAREEASREEPRQRGRSNAARPATKGRGRPDYELLHAAQVIGAEEMRHLSKEGR